MTIIVFTALLLSACGSASKITTVPAPTGTWLDHRFQIDEFVFSADGTYVEKNLGLAPSTTPASGTYSVDGNGNLTLTQLVQSGGTANSSPTPKTYPYSFPSSTTLQIVFPAPSGTTLYDKQ